MPGTQLTLKECLENSTRHSQVKKRLSKLSGSWWAPEHKDWPGTGVSRGEKKKILFPLSLLKQSHSYLWLSMPSMPETPICHLNSTSTSFIFYFYLFHSPLIQTLKVSPGKSHLVLKVERSKAVAYILFWQSPLIPKVPTSQHLLWWMEFYSLSPTWTHCNPPYHISLPGE